MHLINTPIYEDLFVCLFPVSRKDREEIVRVMIIAFKLHMNNICVCRSLLNVFKEVISSTTVVKSETAEIIIGVIGRYSDDLDLSICGCGTLYQLSENMNNHREVIQAGGIELIKKVIDKYITSRDVCRNGCNALSEFTKGMNKASEIPIMEVIAKVMGKHIDNEELCKIGCRVLVPLMQRSKKNYTHSTCLYFIFLMHFLKNTNKAANQKYALENGVIGLVVEAARKYPSTWKEGALDVLEGIVENGK